MGTSMEIRSNNIFWLKHFCPCHKQIRGFPLEWHIHGNVLVPLSLIECLMNQRVTLISLIFLKENINSSIYHDVLALKDHKISTIYSAFNGNNTGYYKYVFELGWRYI